MHILITGVTETHVNDPDRASSTKFVSIPALMAKGLRMLGHTVEHRLVSLGEDLTYFDHAFVYMYPLDGNAINTKNVIYALEQRPDATICLDDWSFQRILPSWEDSISQASLVQREWLAPLFPWGDTKKMALPVSHITAWDPSPLYELELPDYCRTSWKQRKTAWYNASLSKEAHLWAQEQNLKWPIHAVGGKALGQPRMLEADIVWEYGGYKGVMCPTYEHAGCGWWRVRYLHARITGCILGGSVNELGIIGSAYSHTLQEIENMTDMEQESLVYQQAKQLQIATLQTTVMTLKDVLNDSDS